MMNEAEGPVRCRLGERGLGQEPNERRGRTDEIQERGAAAVVARGRRSQRLIFAPLPLLLLPPAEQVPVGVGGSVRTTRLHLVLS